VVLKGISGTVADAGVWRNLDLLSWYIVLVVVQASHQELFRTRTLTIDIEEDALVLS